MLRISNILFTVLFCASICGCATILNGSTQEVTVIVPEGTKIADDLGPEPLSVYRSKNSMILKLKRNKDYWLGFTYKGQSIKKKLSSSLEPGWLAADFFTDLLGYIIDGITGDWNSFENPIFIGFGNDTGIAIDYPEHQILPEEYSPPRKTGLLLSAKGGLVFPATSISGTYGFGLGYDAIPKFTFLLGYEGGGGVSILPQYSNYSASGSFSHFIAECRYTMEAGFYITAGGGVSNVTSDSLEQYRLLYNDTTGRETQQTLRSTPVNKWMPIVFAGIGIAGTTSYLELRQTFGLSNISFSSGETGKFETTSLTFGVNLHF